ncbi:CpaE family protein, partial [Chloroflexota bacterium]
DPDLVVLDLVLPGMDGFEVCHRLRAEDKTARLPILILSGRSQEEDKATALKMGADDFIAKPAKPVEILDRIQSLLTKSNVVNSRTIAFIGSQKTIGTTTTLVNLAIALSQMGKRVIAVDMCPYEGSISQRLGVSPQDGIDLLEAHTDNVKLDDLESTLVTHKTGVRVLRVSETSTHPDNISTDQIELIFDRLAGVTDYFLVDLPFQPTVPVRMVLTQCDLTIIISDCTIEALTDVKSVVTILHFLGISSERIGLVVVDLKRTVPGMVVATIESYIESNLGVILLGVIPYDIKCSAESSPDMVPMVISDPNSLVANSVKALAQQLITMEQIRKDSLIPVVREHE